MIIITLVLYVLGAAMLFGLNLSTARSVLELAVVSLLWPVVAVGCILFWLLI